MTMKSVAIAYAARQWQVFPLAAAGKQPATKHGFQDASTDAAQIAQWWGNGKRFNIGIATGERSGLVVIDLDGPEGLAEWQSIAAPHEPITTLTSLTGGGGAHLLFRWPGLPINNSPISENIHVRADGGYVVAPPSIHPNGTPYRWQDESVAVADMPIWLLVLLTTERGKGVILPSPSEPTKPIEGSSSHISSNGTRLSAYAAAALRSACDRIRGAGEGTRNDTLNREAFSLGAFVRDNHIDRATAEADLRNAALAAGLDEREIDKTLASAINGALSNSRRVIEPKDNRAEAVEAQAAETVQRADAKEKGEKPTDDELVDEWHALHPDTAYGMGEFRRYENGVWEIAPPGRIEYELSDTMREAKARKVRPSGSLLASVRKLAQAMLYVADECWDADYDILTCTNGTLHIPTLQLRAHNPRDYQTSGVPYGYDPDASCPTFEWVLAERIPDAADFVQEFAGYALTTDTRHETALWFFGPRGSGKSTIIEGVQAMLGRRAGTLGLSDIEKNRFSLAGLPGKTLVISTEQPSSFVASTSILNAIISGEPVQVERKYNDPVTFRPKAKVLWAMNELPRLNDSSDGILRRVQVVEFPQTIADRDPQVKETIKGEAAGILNWALAGLKRLQARGRFDIPESVKRANREYEMRNDIPAMFMEAQMERGVDYWIGAESIYTAWKDWCVMHGHLPGSSTKRAEDWKRLGLEHRRMNDGVRYYGAKLKMKIGSNND